MKKTLLTSVLLVFMLVVFVITVSAASKTGTQQYLNFGEQNLNAYTWKKAETNAANTSLRGRIRSYTTGGIVWDIGWDWWSVQQYCGQTPKYSYEYLGHLLHDTDNAASTSPYYSIFICTGRNERVNGEHYFHYGPYFWQPNFTVTMNLP